MIIESFRGQQDGEKVLLATREHWFLLAAKLFLWFLFIVVLFAFDHYAPIYLPQLYAAPYLNYVTIFKNLYVMFLMLGLFMIITMYYLNLHIVTDRRVMDFDQTGLFSQTIAEITYDSVEDVSSAVNGFWGTLFEYGTVEVQTAGEKENIILKNIPRAHDAEKLIFAQLKPRIGAIGNGEQMH